ncbi:hypothetical protein [Velocimicrobium porci]|uniref:Uncharacterized protein n=1 Tax=Velocimicrobium porci TaxID=2606634 RepID=A0A6L5XVU8_9FIRM|nr:hypothetical protein [Velocimicrobium porci]MSS62945.1 hypothetical protein [Velocimicrobium porci]
MKEQTIKLCIGLTLSILFLISVNFFLTLEQNPYYTNKQPTYKETIFTFPDTIISFLGFNKQ